MTHVEPLQKISVTIRAGAAPGDLNLPLAHPEVTFICGIGTGGMTPFEYLLAGRTPGDEISFGLDAGRHGAILRALGPGLRRSFPGPQRGAFSGQAHRHRAGGRPRLVRAMAELTARAGSGGCDCG